jgi:glucose-6-phosphate 1-dehydrogenase
MFLPDSGVGTKGPDHLTFDLADDARLSLSFYGKRPGPGLRMDKLSMQFATSETEDARDVLEAYARLILDALRGDHTLFTTAEGIESLWERSIPLLEDPPPVKPYAPGSWGPNAIHQLIAPTLGGSLSSAPGGKAGNGASRRSVRPHGAARLIREAPQMRLPHSRTSGRVMGAR